MRDGSQCKRCRGSGFIHYSEETIDVDINELDSPRICETCGLDLHKEFNDGQGTG